MDWDAKVPWTCCFRELASDSNFWDEQVRHPATAWLASGGRGAPLTPAEALAQQHLPGGFEIPTEKEGLATKSQKTLDNKAKREAKKRKLASDREELKKLRQDGGGSSGLGKGSSRPTGGDGSGGKGKSKGKYKTEPGTDAQLCFSWNNMAGVCADVAVGAPCKQTSPKVHKCQICLSPGHQMAKCPQLK